MTQSMRNHLNKKENRKFEDYTIWGFRVLGEGHGKEKMSWGRNCFFFFTFFVQPKLLLYLEFFIF